MRRRMKKVMSDAITRSSKRQLLPMPCGAVWCGAIWSAQSDAAQPLGDVVQCSRRALHFSTTLAQCNNTQCALANRSTVLPDATRCTHLKVAVSSMH